MEKIECSFKVLTTSELEKNLKEEKPMPVFLSKKELDNVKHLMFAALEDPRKNYKVINNDEMAEYWKNPYGC